MDNQSDTIEIHSFLIQDRLIYTLLFLNFGFFLSFFVCVIKFKEIKNFVLGKSYKCKSILPVQTPKTKQLRSYDKYKYTNLEQSAKKYNPPSSDQTYQNDDSDFKRNLASRPLISPTSSSVFSDDQAAVKTISKKRPLKETDLITFPSLIPSVNAKKQSVPKETIEKKQKYECGFKIKDRQCYKKDCRRKGLLSKIACKYYNKYISKLKRNSPSPPTSDTDRSTVPYRYDRESTGIKSPTPSLELDRERALKCYQDFLDNRLCKPDPTNVKRIFGNDTEKRRKEKKNEDTKTITSEAFSNATILTPKQLRMYEPFKAEIANPAKSNVDSKESKSIASKSDEYLYKDVYKEFYENFNNNLPINLKKNEKKTSELPNKTIDDDEDDENSSYVHLTKNLDKKIIEDFEKKIVSGIDFKQPDEEQDYNFLRLANQLRKQQESGSKAETKMSSELIRNPKFYRSKSNKNQISELKGIEIFKKSDISLDDSIGDRSDKPTDKEESKHEIPDLNKLFKEKINNNGKEIKIFPFEKGGKDEGLTSKSSDEDDTKLFRKDSAEKNITEKSKAEKTKPDQSLYISDSTSSSSNRQPPKIISISHDIRNTNKSDTKSRDKAKKSDYKIEVMKNEFSDETGSRMSTKTEDGQLVEMEGNEDGMDSLVNKMKNEMKQLKPIEFKPLQTVFLKQPSKTNAISELKIAKVTFPRSTSPSLNSERLFTRNLSLNDDAMIKENSDDLIDLSTSTDRMIMDSIDQTKDGKTKKKSKQKSSSPVESTKTSFLNKLNLNNILNLKDRQLDAERPSLNVTSIDKESSEDLKSNMKQNKSTKFEPIDKSGKLISIERQDSGRAEKKSKIPIPVDKFKKSKSLTLQKKSLFGRNSRLINRDSVDRDLERMFDQKYKKIKN